jgi:conjugative relaxase-like TrwC/TraI family protein
VVGVMSMSRLSAGAGYRYLLKNIARGDIDFGPRLLLTPTAYYAATGNPPGRWLGTGLAGLMPGELELLAPRPTKALPPGALQRPAPRAPEALTPGTPEAIVPPAPEALVPGAVVTEEAMAALYGSGHNPLTGEQLGRPCPTYKKPEDRIAEAIAGLPAELSEPARHAAIAAIQARVEAAPARSAVAGFDLTFTAPKSASILWALGDETVQDAVVEAHREALDAVLELIEDRFLFTRTGTNSCMQVETRGLIAAAFDHYDTRTGDPNLHTHVVIANKVQGPDGKWRSVDAQVLYRAAVACSEVYDTVFADALAARLPVTWAYRDRGPRRTPGFEIEGISDNLLAAFSARSTQIGVKVEDLVAGFTATHGREPSRVEMLRLRQQATLATRPDKQMRPLAEMRATWRATATTVTGEHPRTIVAAALAAGNRSVAATAATVPDPAALAEQVLAGISVRRSTWTPANLLAEAARATRHLRTGTPQERLQLLDQVVQAAQTQCVSLDPPPLFHSPARFRRLDGASVFDRAEDAVFSTTAVLDTEARLVAAFDDLAAPALSSAFAARAVRPIPGQRPAPDQLAAATGIATSGRRLDVLVGPAGTGKTRTLAMLTMAWQVTHGPGSVVGLAPSATAAAEIALALRIPCETTAKWLHQRDDAMTEAAPSLAASTLVIVDEASMASTADLDAVLRHVTAAGAKLLLVGDHHQLGAVEAGGAFALLADTATERGHAHTLAGLWRFQHRWEADATRALRSGDPAAVASALDGYAANDRLHEGDPKTVVESAYEAWRRDLAAGHDSLLIAADRATVTSLNLRARIDRIGAGEVSGPEAGLHDGTRCAEGDWITTRRNDRRLPVPGGGYVRNGASWQVTQVHPDGSVDARTRGAQTDAAAVVQLPSRYVAEHVELGYATTVHRAQGATVDTAHTVVTTAMTRQSLYVAMTRGRDANHAHNDTGGLPGVHHEAEGHLREAQQLIGRQMLERIIATDGTELSATATLRERQEAAASPGRLRPIRDTLAAAAGDPEAERALAEINALLAARRARPGRTTAAAVGLEHSRAHIRGSGPTITPGG